MVVLGMSKVVNDYFLSTLDKKPPHPRRFTLDISNTRFFFYQIYNKR